MKLTFHQTKAEVMVRAAATVLFNKLQCMGTPQKTLTELTEMPQYGFTASSSIEPIGPKMVRITDIQDGTINWDSVPFCQCQESDKYLLKPNDILFARTGATTGKTYLVKEAPFAVFASYLIRIRPKLDINPAYLYSFFQSDLYWSQIAMEKEGSAQPNVNGKKLSSIEMPIVNSTLQSAIATFLQVVRDRQDGSKELLPELPPPLQRQRHIVARIEKLAANIEEARRLRKKAGEEAEALLLASREKIFKSFSDCIGILSQGIFSAKNGLSRRPAGDEIGPIVLRLADVSNGRVDLTAPRRGYVSKAELEKYSLNTGDLLFVRVNGSQEIVGRCIPFRGASETICYNDHLIRVQLDSEVLDWEYTSVMVNSPFAREYVEKTAITTAGQFTINQNMLSQIPIPIPPLPEQRRIVAYLDSLQEKVDTLRHVQAETSAKLDALMPAVLDRAFKGELA